MAPTLTICLQYDNIFGFFIHGHLPCRSYIVVVDRDSWQEVSWRRQTGLSPLKRRWCQKDVSPASPLLQRSTEGKVDKVRKWTVKVLLMHKNNRTVCECEFLEEICGIKHYRLKGWQCNTEGMLCNGSRGLSGFWLFYHKSNLKHSKGLNKKGLNQHRLVCFSITELKLVLTVCLFLIGL